MVIKQLSEKEARKIHEDILKGTPYSREMFRKLRKLEDESQRGCGPRYESAGPSYPSD
jgi:hypothetical protein